MRAASPGEGKSQKEGRQPGLIAARSSGAELVPVLPDYLASR